MNVIFLDFDGVLNTLNDRFDDDVSLEKRIKLLADICREYNCKIVIEAALKLTIDEDTLTTTNSYVQKVFSLFNKYGIECIGRTPEVAKRYSVYSYVPMWKEDEIRLYLYRHPEIEHYCVLDDDDMAPNNSDLNKVRDHLVKTNHYSKDGSGIGLLPEHRKLIGEVLKKENNIRKLVLKHK